MYIIDKDNIDFSKLNLISLPVFSIFQSSFFQCFLVFNSVEICEFLFYRIECLLLLSVVTVEEKLYPYDEINISHVHVGC